MDLSSSSTNRLFSPVRQALLSLIHLVLKRVVVLTLFMLGATEAWAQQEVDLPGAWRSGFAEGWSTYRARVFIPGDWKDHPLDVFVEGADDAREVVLNGESVVKLGEFPPDYRSGLGGSGRYAIRAERVKYNEWNEIEVRVFRDRGRENLNIAALALFTDTQAIHLAGKWEYFPGAEKSPGDGTVAEAYSFEKVEPSADVTSVLQRLEGDRGRQSAEAAAALMHAGEGLVVQQVLSDPIIGQPLSIKWDSKGRLWVAEYRQYPDPVGLTVVSRDPFLRSVYDRVPPPPPHHDRGLDRISIHSDSDGDGKLDDHRVFIDGLNLATSFAIGRGGVFVLNPPYLLFYPDRDQDDVPDSDPELLLRGFGLEDSHSLANSLRWGPDGWLYGAQGSTVSAEIVIEGVDAVPVRSVGQLIWRFHPEQKRFEIFAEGGGNAFGIELDSHGDVFSGHNGGDTRGFHYVQGAYLQKGFSKHGELSNPYAFGYFSWMSHHAVPRFTHTFVIDEGGLFPEPWAGRLFGVEPLQGRVVMSDVSARGSTYQTQDQGYALTSDDSWFRPVDIQSGPDGALYVADFYEQRIDHASHYQGRIDRDSGRIYRIAPQTTTELDLSYSFETQEALLASLSHPNRWVRQTALALIWDQPDRVSANELREQLKKRSEGCVDLFWAVAATGSLSDADVIAALSHGDPDVRRWAVRMIGDSPDRFSAEVSAALVSRCAEETEARVWSQMASTARRLNVSLRLEMLGAICQHETAADDPYVPLLTWWALESACGEAPGAVAEFCRRSNFAESKLAQSVLLERAMRRFVAAGDRQSLLVAAQLLSQTPTQATAERLLTGFDQAMAGRTLNSLPQELANELLRLRPDSLELKVILADAEAIDEAKRRVGEADLALDARLSLARVLSAQRSATDFELWSSLLSTETPSELRIVALSALMDQTHENVPAVILSAWPGYSDDEKLVAQTTLASRKEWAMALVQAVDEGSIAINELSSDTIRRMNYHSDEGLQNLLRTMWPDLATEANPADEGAILALSEQITAGNGNPYDGRVLFNDRCAKCHRLFGSGGELGPDLTSYQRTDLMRLLSNVVNPSQEIREGFKTEVIETDDGLVITGFLESQDDSELVVKQADGRAVRVLKEAIVDRFDSPDSLMPAGLLTDLDPQQLRDLFAYLRSAQPLP